MWQHVHCCPSRLVSEMYLHVCWDVVVVNQQQHTQGWYCCWMKRQDKYLVFVEPQENQFCWYCIFFAGWTFRWKQEVCTDVVRGEVGMGEWRGVFSGIVYVKQDLKQCRYFEGSLFSINTQNLLSLFYPCKLYTDIWNDVHLASVSLSICLARFVVM